MACRIKPGTVNGRGLGLVPDSCGFESRPVRKAGYSHAIKPNNSVARLALPGTRRPGGSPGRLSIWRGSTMAVHGPTEVRPLWRCGGAAAGWVNAKRRRVDHRDGERRRDAGSSPALAPIDLHISSPSYNVTWQARADNPNRQCLHEAPPRLDRGTCLRGQSGGSSRADAARSRVWGETQTQDLPARPGHAPALRRRSGRVLPRRRRGHSVMPQGPKAPQPTDIMRPDRGDMRPGPAPQERRLYRKVLRLPMVGRLSRGKGTPTEFHTPAS